MHTGLDNGTGKLPRGHTPHRKNWLQSRIFQLLLTVCPNVRQEEIAKSNAFDARLNSILALLFHDALVVGIRAGRWQTHLPQRNARCLRLCLHEATTHRVHSDPIRLLIESRKQPDNFVLILLPEKVKAPSTILSTAP